MLFDSHCHLTDSRFDEDRASVVRRATEAGVASIVTIASDLDDAEAVLALISDSDLLWGTVGVHPHEADHAPTGLVERLTRLAGHPRVVAIGECGLDFHYDHSPRSTQMEVFRAQLSLAAELGLPVVVHSRDAEDETVGILEEFGPSVRGVLHCFTGGRRLLDAGLAQGWYVSLSAIATFARFDRDIVRAIPSERLLIETDAPYLAPKPHRGSRNEPAYVRFVAERIAEIREVTVEALAHSTSGNAKTFYGIAHHA